MSYFYQENLKGIKSSFSFIDWETNENIRKQMIEPIFKWHRAKSLQMYKYLFLFYSLYLCVVFTSQCVVEYLSNMFLLQIFVIGP